MNQKPRAWIKWFERAAGRFLRAGIAMLSFVMLDVGNATVAQTQGLRGEFSLLGMAHTSNWPTAPDVAPWDGHSDGHFLYRAVPCSGHAPLNNNASDLPSYNTRIPGSRVPASVRAHPLRLTVEKGDIRGTLHLTVCQLEPGPTSDGRPDAQRDKIFIEFHAVTQRFSVDEVAFRGLFRLTGGTGRYADLTGEGNIAGFFLCYDPKGCRANAGRYRDVQFVLHGTYFDPTGPN